MTHSILLVRHQPWVTYRITVLQSDQTLHSSWKKGWITSSRMLLLSDKFGSKVKFKLFEVYQLSFVSVVWRRCYLVADDDDPCTAPFDLNTVTCRQFCSFMCSAHFSCMRKQLESLWLAWWAEEPVIIISHWFCTSFGPKRLMISAFYQKLVSF